eukprot:Pgem_evm1s3769
MHSFSALTSLLVFFTTNPVSASPYGPCTNPSSFKVPAHCTDSDKTKPNNQLCFIPYFTFKCNKCDTAGGFYLNEEVNFCATCEPTPHCVHYRTEIDTGGPTVNCTGAKKTQECGLCESDYVLNDNVCSLCPIDNKTKSSGCKYYSSVCGSDNKRVCEKCNDNDHILVNNVCTNCPKKSGNNCTSYENTPDSCLANGDRKCLTCSQYSTLENNACKACSPVANCKFYETDIRVPSCVGTNMKCKFCESGYQNTPVNNVCIRG